MLVWLQVRKLNKKLEDIRVIKAIGSHELIILKFFWGIESYILYQINQAASKLDYYFANYDKFTDNCWYERYKIENQYCLFRHLAQYLGSDKWWILSPSVTNWCLQSVTSDGIKNLKQHANSFNSPIHRLKHRRDYRTCSFKDADLPHWL